jgi:hypothetical protein
MARDVDDRLSSGGPHCGTGQTNNPCEPCMIMVVMVVYLSFAARTSIGAQETKECESSLWLASSPM